MSKGAPKGWAWRVVPCAVALLASACGFEHGVLPPLPTTSPNAYDCACQCRSLRTLELSLSASEDDAEQDTSSNTMSLTGGTLDLVDQPTFGQLVGVRFRNVAIPAGSTIGSAYIQFTATVGTAGTSSMRIAAQASDDAPAFTGTAGNLGARPLTTAVATWAPAAWVGGEAGADQRTVDLGPLVQEVVGRPGWAAGNALAFVFGLEPSEGRRAAYSFDGRAASAPRLVVTFLEPAAAAVSVLEKVCVPGDLNPNLVSRPALVDADVQADCSDRVQDTLSGLAAACAFPNVCTCDAVPGTLRLSETCNGPCSEVPVDAACSNFDPTGGTTTATNAPGDAPVCITASPLSAGLFGQASLCQVEGTATFTTDDETKTPGARGRIELTGRPCPGGACSVGLRYGLDLDPITFSSLFGSATFSDLASVGATLPGQGAQLSSAGVGLFPVNATRNTLRGRRGSDVRGYLGSNSDALGVSVAWGPGGACSLSGALVGTVDPELSRCEPFGPDASKACASGDDCADVPECSDGVCDCAPVGSSANTLALAVSGPLLNQPPTAVAGADQTVECSAAGGSVVTLASSSTDADGNIRQVGWLRGGRTGTLVGTTPSANVVQAVGTGETYVLRVVDAFAQGDEARTHVQVVDTTPPVISCNAPASLSPPDRPVSFTATASDVCDPTATPRVLGYDCFKRNGAGKQVDKTHSCKVSFAGDTLTVWHTGGVGTRITWDVAVTDTSGNTATRTCALDTVVP